MARAAVLLLAVTVLAMLPHAWLHDWNGTEGRRVQIALEMLRNGDWMTPTLWGVPTYAKPPLHYWLLAGSAWLFGDGFVALRLPSIALVWLSSLLAFVLLRRAYGTAAAWVAALGVATAPTVVAGFASAEIDPPFASLTAMSLWCLACGAARQRRILLVAAGLCGGAALLLKGPPYFVFAAGALLVWWRHRRCRGFLAFALPLLLVPACYYVPLLTSVVGWDEFRAVANAETVGRLSAYEWKHVLDIPSFWLRAVLVQMPLLCWCFWEWRSARDARMGPADLTLRMCSGAAVLAVALLTLFPGKPTRYLLPNVPLFTFAVAPAAAHYATRCAALGGIARGSLRTLGLLGALALMIVPFAPAPLPMRTPAFALVAALVPLIVRTPRQLLAMCFWGPVLAGWTVLADYRDQWEVGTRARAPHGELLRHELQVLEPNGAAARDLVAYGHVHGGFVLGAGLLPMGREAADRQPDARFVLREDEALPPLPPLQEYRQRVRMCVPGELFVIEERVPR